MPGRDGTGPIGFGKGRSKGIGCGTGGGYRGMGDAMNMSNPSITGTVGSQIQNTPTVPTNIPENSNEQVTKGKERKINMVAVVDAISCIGCGLCADVCPKDAISVDEIAEIDREKCTGCGTCVEECPQDAISLT